ncbi:hypothetical protein MPK67_gp243 [Erwinia phage pEa_SNUABM_32]|uniref:Uncharacterized protein n=2 Tax=Alexandravirus TaxID=2733088 RepID=A0AAE7XLF2_9CAUD|nr:hypothetical protein MPK67_gp243 [Erwinia phage pEa_SNUABM_32]YP_010302696.1 hypothetical protein MPK72_gp237 [Erwinia phage pEa_SNUABM_17]QZE57116.1 hypothetical protein pEaSNUABM32_00243 [Erwinia phage pEa_SNUABM_32]QZE57783.1 hypothetical protein pEaSNUABM17_00237 [Erwinia phage pEa_SNUABM_17]
MMNNLVGLVAALDHCRFYAENMVHIQFGSSLCAVPPAAPYNQPINERRLHSLAESIELAFDNAISRTDLEFPIQGILYRFRSIFGYYVSQCREDIARGRPYTSPRGTPVPAVPERLAGEHEKEFASRFLKYTSDQVSAFLYMVCLDQYAREQTDMWLPDPAPAFDLPKDIHSDNPIAFTTMHNVLINHLMEAMLQTHSDTLDIHVSLRDYGLTVLFPLVAECRNVIYAAWPVMRGSFRKPRFMGCGEHIEIPDMEDDSCEEDFEPIPEMGPMFENQAKWEDIAKSVAAGLGLTASTDDSDSGFELIPDIYASADDFMYRSIYRYTEKYVFDIAFVPADAYPDMRHIQALHEAMERIQKHALDFNCHTITRLVGYNGELKTMLIRVQRNVDFPAQDFVIENLLGALNV